MAKSRLLWGAVGQQRWRAIAKRVLASDAEEDTSNLFLLLSSNWGELPVICFTRVLSQLVVSAFGCVRFLRFPCAFRRRKLYWYSTVVVAGFRHVCVCVRVCVTLFYQTDQFFSIRSWCCENVSSSVADRPLLHVATLLSLQGFRNGVEYIVAGVEGSGHCRGRWHLGFFWSFSRNWL